MREWQAIPAVPSGERPKYAEKQLWSFFDSYKKPGVGCAVARPDIDSFRHISDETKRRDHALLQQKMNRPLLRQQNEEGPDAFAFENFLTSEAMRQHWLGGELSPTANYDDWVSGVDAVVEWTDEAGEPIRLAIDFTATKKIPVFMKKSDKLEANIQVKYLRSRVETEHGQPKELRVSLPVVLLGVDNPVYRLIAEKHEILSHEHPLRRLLLEQATAQIDLQIKLLVGTVFESAGAKRNKGARDLQEQYLTLGKDYTVDQAINFMHGLSTKSLGMIMSEKNQQRFKDLARLKNRLDAELATAQSIELDNEWTAAVKQSITHNVLSG